MNDNSTIETTVLSKTQKKKLDAQAYNEKMRANLVEDSRPTNEQRDELERLSLKLFRASSKWQTLLKKGILELVTDEVTEVVEPGMLKNGEVVVEAKTETNNVPRNYNGAEKSFIYTIKRFTVTSLLTELQAREKKYDEFVAKIEEMRKAEQAKKDAEALAEKVQEQAGGSTLG